MAKKRYILVNTLSISGKGNQIFRCNGDSFTEDQLPEGVLKKYLSAGVLEEVKIKVPTLLERLEPLTDFDSIKAEFSYGEVKELVKFFDLTTKDKTENTLVNAILTRK